MALWWRSSCAYGRIVSPISGLIICQHPLMDSRCCGQKSQGVHLQLIDHSSMIGVNNHRYSEATVARGKAVTWDALIIC